MREVRLVDGRAASRRCARRYAGDGDRVRLRGLRRGRDRDRVAAQASACPTAARPGHAVVADDELPAAFGGASNVTLIVVVLTELALATLKPVRPVNVPRFVVSGSPSVGARDVVDRDRVRLDRLRRVVIVTVLPRQHRRADTSRPGRCSCDASTAATGSGGASNVTVIETSARRCRALHVERRAALEARARHGQRLGVARARHAGDDHRVRAGSPAATVVNVTWLPDQDRRAGQLGARARCSCPSCVASPAFGAASNVDDQRRARRRLRARDVERRAAGEARGRRGQRLAVAGASDVRDGHGVAGRRLRRRRDRHAVAGELRRAAERQAGDRVVRERGRARRIGRPHRTRR